MSLNHRVIAKIMHHASKSRNRAQHIANDFTNASDQNHGRTFNRIVTFHFMNLLMHTNEIPFFFFGESAIKIIFYSMLNRLVCITPQVNQHELHKLIIILVVP